MLVLFHYLITHKTHTSFFEKLSTRERDNRQRGSETDRHGDRKKQRDRIKRGRDREREGETERQREREGEG